MNPEDNTNSNPDMPNPAPVDTTTTDLPDLDSAAAEVTAAVEEAAPSEPVTPDMTEPVLDMTVDAAQQVDPADPATSVTPEEPPVEEPVNIEPAVAPEQPINIPNAPAPSTAKKNSSNIVIIILIIALVAVLGAIAYVLFFM